MSEAERITRALGGSFHAGQGLAPCPFCQPEGRRDQRALSLTDKGGRLLLHCHKGNCNVLAEIRARGLIGHAGRDAALPDPAEAERRRAEERQREAKRLEAAHRLFAEGVSCEGTPTAAYLERRGLAGLRFGKMVRTLKYHPSVLHTPSGLRLPAMLAQVRGPKGQEMGLHRTYLRPDGSGKADVSPSKMMLGASGGGAVRFGPDCRVIALAEGIETALSIGLASRMTVWACLSTSGLKALILPPPPVAEVVIVAADHDPAGLEAAEVAAGRIEAEGRAVSIIRPRKAGQDFNDVLRDEADNERP